MKLKESIKKYRILFSALLTIIIGIILLSISGINVISSLSKLLESLLHPFETARVGLTVAENTQQYLSSLINQIGTLLFWIFYAGIVLVGSEISKGIKQKKSKVLFIVSWIIMVSGILFSRISAVSLMDGISFISRFIYFGGLLLFAGCCIWIYFHSEIKIKGGLIIIASWLLFTMIAGMGAVRLLFVVTPTICFMVGYCIVNMFSYAVNNKDELFKLLLVIAVISIIGWLIFTSFTFTGIITKQAESMGPSVNFQWQQAMSWVRDNTPIGSIFVHWWDYGYWVEYLGERPSVTDGGHAINFWDHLIGRYVLTTQNPKTALSFMKSHNVSYLLIDQTDFGKYPAYSKIGSDNTGEDRFASIPIMLLDTSQTTETRTGETMIYQGASYVDEDIIYTDEDTGREILLPSQNAVIMGIILQTNNSGNLTSLNQPEAVFFYNGQEFIIPLRYVYIGGIIIDFNSGLNAVVSVIPMVSQTNQGQIQIDGLGSAIYLSPKVSKSLFAQLYLLNNVFGTYPTINLVHAESDTVVERLNYQGANLEEIIYFNGFRGPIKILEVKYPDEIIIKEEFLRANGEYAEFDNLQFVKGDNL